MAKTIQENTVFVIDDDEIIRLSCEQILKKSGYEVETFASGINGIERLKQVSPPLLVVDIKMPELDGFEVIKIVRKIDPDVVIVVITGYATIETAVDAMKMGAYDFLPKPFTPSELRLIIERGFERWHLAREAQLLRKQKEEVERKFVTLVSHQLKGPLAAVKQYLDVLLYTCKDQFHGETLEWISRSQARISEMLNLIHDWLMMAKLDRGSLCDRNASADIGMIIENIVEEYQQLPSSKNLSLSFEIAPGLKPVCGDAVSLSMLFGNLVSNAVKYNIAGGTVMVRAAGDDKWVHVEVSDTGLGIPESFRPHLFEEFSRVRSQETQNIPGTGLGLVICKKIVDELGGSIELDSKEGEYTTFIVKLPVAEPKKEVGSAEETAGSHLTEAISGENNE
ncbi:MAG: response regulator [Acidobacteria bacterium]|nr:response regulator [Acidobacteriota bacterium]